MDFIAAADGTVLHGLALIYVLRDLPGIKSFKIMQESLACMRLQLVVDESLFTQKEEDFVKDQFITRLGRGVEIEFEYVAEIPLEKSGKFRYVISNVTAEVG